MHSPLDRRPRVLVADPIAPAGLELLEGTAEVEVRPKLSERELVELVPAYAALLVRSETKVTAAVIEAGTQLRVIGRAGVGVDNIDVEAATRRGILVVNAPTGNTVAAAEHTLALMLALARNIPQGDSSLRQGRWERSRLVGTELHGKTLLVVGLGKIGAELARMVRGLQMHVLAFDPLVPPERGLQLGVELVALDEGLGRADFVTVHTPLTDATRGLIGAREMALMPQGARVLNVGRGGIVDEGAVAAAVASGHLAGAAFDVFTREPPPPDHPLLQDPRILVTPHLGASTVEAQLSVATDVAAQVRDVLEGRPARWAVNSPPVSPEEASVVVPYQDLAWRLGSLWAQLGGGKVRAVELEYRGEVASVHPAAITASALGGLLRHFSHDPVTPVNAQAIASRHGITVRERRVPDAGASSLLLRVDGEGTGEIEGAVVLGEPRVIRLEGLPVDLVPQGRLLVLRHLDRPGLIGDLGRLLGEANVNIGEMRVGRDSPRGRAITALSLDDPVPAEVGDRLRAIPGVESARLVEL